MKLSRCCGFAKQVTEIMESVVQNAKEVDNLESEDIQSLDPSFNDIRKEDHGNFPWTCCKSVLLSSSGRARDLYSSLLGNYSQLDGPSEAPVFKKSDADMFLYKPKSQKPKTRYSWSVGHSPNLMWGYIESTADTACPDTVRVWMVYDRDIKRWAEDATLDIKCYTNSK